MATISTNTAHPRPPGVSIVAWAAMHVDRAAAERAERERIAAVNADRRSHLYGRLFQHVTPSRDVARLRTEQEANDMLSRAQYVDNRLQVEILRVAVDNRWGSVVTAFIKFWGTGEDRHPIADTVQELWTLTLTLDLSRSAI